jgi:hypothetical protein
MMGIACFFRIVCFVLATAESDPASSEYFGEHHGARCKSEDSYSCPKNGDGTDSQILLQSYVRSAIEDQTPMHYKVETNDTVKALQMHTYRSQSGSSNSFWTHPLVLGILLGLFLIGPDHLGTLMALSTLTSGFTSFKRGFQWGAGHSVGVMLLCPIFLLLEHVTSKAITKESWQHYGDMFIGISMISVSIYFIYYESFYIQRQDDGTYVAKGCACHGPLLPTTASVYRGTSSSSPSAQGSQKLTIDDYSDLGVCGPCVPKPSSILSLTTPQKQPTSPPPEKQPTSPPPENQPTSPPPGIDDSGSSWDLFINSFLGLMQGLCCPLGMTAGTGFMSRVTATASTPMIVAFMVEFFLASGVGSGLIALGWGAVSMRGSGSFISGKLIYIATCVLLLLFGIVWLVAHSLGVLGHIDFGEKIHKKLIPVDAQF